MLILRRQRNYLGRKILAVIIIFTAWFDYMLFFSSVKPIATAEHAQPPDHQYSELELVNRRTENSKLFDLGNGYYKLVAYSEPIHYLTDGNYKEINSQFSADNDTAYAFKTNGNSFIVRAGATADQGIQYEYKGAKVEFIPQGEDFNRNAKASIKLNSVIYEEIYPFVDWEITMHNGAVVNELIVKSSRGIAAKYSFLIESSTGHETETLSDGSIAILKEKKAVWATDPSLMYDSKSSESLSIKSVEVAETEVIIEPNKEWINSRARTFPIKLDPSLSFSAIADTFVSPSTKNPANGTRRMMTIGDYTDYTMPEKPLFDNSRALINFGVLNLPANAIVQDGHLSLWHYGTNSGHGTVFVSRITTSWTDRAIWPGPSYSGNYGSMLFPHYNSNTQARERQISISTSLINILRSSNFGVMVRNVNESDKGVVVCASEIPSGPCQSGHNPKISVVYSVNQPPNPPNLDYPHTGWELGPISNGVYPGVTCGTNGTGEGCTVEHKFQTEDPDNTFPLTTYVDERSLQGGNRSFSVVQNGEGWTSYHQHLHDGNWNWFAQTQDALGDTSPPSVTKSFLVDTTAPTVPNMISEPEYSQGYQNTVESIVSTDSVVGGVRYNFQSSISNDFSVISADSGWLSVPYFTFPNLDDGSTYYYRARSQDKLGNVSNWGSPTASTQDATFPNIVSLDLSNTVISPRNQDGRFDSALLSFAVEEENFKQSSATLVSIESTTMLKHTSNNKADEFEFDGKDSIGNYLPDGFYEIIFTSEDKAGNVTVADSKILKVDNSGALINVSFPSANSWFNRSSVAVSGISETDASLAISNKDTGEIIHATIDPSTGVFQEEGGLGFGANNFLLEAVDPVGNISSFVFCIYREEAPPVIEAILPEAIINDVSPTISVFAHDEGYVSGDNFSYVSGIDVESLYLSIQHTDYPEVVLISEGVNIHPELGDVAHFCEGERCVFSYVFTVALQPDGHYNVIAKMRDIAGNITIKSAVFELDSHTLLEVTSPPSGTLFNHSLIAIEGSAEMHSAIQVEGLKTNLSFVVDQEQFYEDISIENCRPSENATKDGIKKVCDWRVEHYELKTNTEKEIAEKNFVTYSIEDPAGNALSKTYAYFVDLYAVNLSLTTDLDYFSPNGDGRQDGVNFINFESDAQIQNWKLNIFKNDTDALVKSFVGASVLPFSIYWDGKYDFNDPENEGLEYVVDGDYSYILEIETTDNILFRTNPLSIYARTLLDSSLVISYPKNNSVTTRGVTNVQGQSPPETMVSICVDTIGLPSECDFEYQTGTNSNGSFSTIIPLIRLPENNETKHIISATATDKFGNKINSINTVSVVVDTVDPFVNVSVIPAVSGVNDPEAYQTILDKLQNDEEITRQDIADLKTIVLRSTVSKNTERVKLRYSDFTNLLELPDSMQSFYIGYTDVDISESAAETGLYKQYTDGENKIYRCEETECVWDFYYPVPPVTGGVYEFEFNGKKGESVNNAYAGVIIDGTVPMAPTILTINKVKDGTVARANRYYSKYYSNSPFVEIVGVAEPSLAIYVEDQKGKTICDTVSNSIGLFVCQSDISKIYPDEYNSIELELLPLANDGQNVTPGIDKALLTIDTLPPRINSLVPNREWFQSGSVAAISFAATEPISIAYTTTPDGAKHSCSISALNNNGNVAVLIPGYATEGKYRLVITLFDLAGNTETANIVLYIDNTPPDSETIVKKTHNGNWGEFSGANAFFDTPAKGRLVPEYIIRGSTLEIHGVAEQNTSVEVYVNGKMTAKAKTNKDACVWNSEPLLSRDGTIVKNGNKCKWNYTFHFVREAGHVFAIKVVDRAGNSSLISKNEIVYYDKTAPALQTVNELPKISNKLALVVTGTAEPLSDLEFKSIHSGKRQAYSGVTQNSSNGKYKVDFSLGTTADTGGCVKLDNGRLIGICEDGNYELFLASIDAAGNRSILNSILVERDTVAPETPQVKLSLHNSNIIARITGETGSTLTINGKTTKHSLDPSGTITIDLVENFAGEKKYVFTISLIDTAGNESNLSVSSLVTTATVQGDPHVEGAQTLNPWGDKGYQWEQVPVSADVYIDNNGSYSFSNVVIPKPVITYIDWDLENYYVYGYGAYVGKPINFNVYRSEYNAKFYLYEALDKCGVNYKNKIIFGLSSAQFACTRNLLGISTFALGNWLKMIPISLNYEGNTVTVPAEYQGKIQTTIDHSLIHVYKNNTWQEPSTPPPWRPAGDSTSEGRFRFDWPIQIIEHPDKISITTKLYGTTTWQGKPIKYIGLESAISNTHRIPKTEIEGVKAVLLDVPFFNQYIEPNQTRYPTDGWKMCGAASGVMTVGYFGRLVYAFSDGHSLKKYMYSDSGQGIPNNKCGGGAFEMTSAGTCSRSYAEHIAKYLLKSADKQSKHVAKLKFDEIKENIDNKKPVIIAVGDSKQGGFGHVLVIIGYTSNGKLVVNDPYTNLQKYGRGWQSYNTGEKAVYNYDDKRWYPKWYIKLI